MRVYHDFSLLPASWSTFPEVDPDLGKWSGSNRNRNRIRTNDPDPKHCYIGTQYVRGFSGERAFIKLDL